MKARVPLANLAEPEEVLANYSKSYEIRPAIVGITVLDEFSCLGNGYPFLSTSDVRFSSAFSGDPRLYSGEWGKDVGGWLASKFVWKTTFKVARSS
jgi:hypothetical protein